MFDGYQWIMLNEWMDHQCGYVHLQCNAALGMKTLFDHLYAPPPKVMLFGDACNSVTDPIAKASRFFHLIQVSTLSIPQLIVPIMKKDVTSMSS